MSRFIHIRKTILILFFGIIFSTNAYAWFFFWLPLGKGENKDPNILCLGTASKIGDHISHPNGGIVKVTEIYGKDSSFCANVNFPNKAKVEHVADVNQENDQDFAAAQETTVHNTSQAKIELSEDWKQQELLPSFKEDKSIIFYSLNKSLDLGMLVASTDRTDITNITDFINTKNLDLQKKYSNKYADIKTSKLVEFEVNGVKTYQISITGTQKKTGINITDLRTFYIGDKEILLINIFSNDYKIDADRDVINKILYSVSGLTSAPAATKLKTSGEFASDKSVITEDKLIELKKMFDDGLINATEYQVKKKEILNKF